MILMQLEEFVYPEAGIRDRSRKGSVWGKNKRKSFDLTHVEAALIGRLSQLYMERYHQSLLPVDTPMVHPVLNSGKAALIYILWEWML